MGSAIEGVFLDITSAGNLLMKIAIASGLALGLIAVQPALAQSTGSNPNGLYFGGAAGLDYYDNDDNFDFDGGASLALQLGYRFSDNWRAQVEANLTGVNLDGGDDDDVLGILRGTASLYYDFLSSDNLLVPYAGAGLGIAGVIVDLEDVDDDDEDFEAEFTWHAEAGLSINFNEHFALVPAYRYTWIDDSENVTADNLEGHSFRLGARISF